MKHSEILKEVKIRHRSVYDTFDRAFICNTIKSYPYLGTSKQRTEIINLINDSMKKDAKNNADKYFLNSYGLMYWLYLKGCIGAKAINYSTYDKWFHPDICDNDLQTYRERFIDELIHIYETQGK